MTAIIFDLNGTLIDSVGDIHAALNQMLAQAGHDPLAIETETSFVGKGSSNLMKRVIDHVGLPDDAASHAHYLSEFLDIYTSVPAKLTTVFDHFHEVLTVFQSFGITLGLCTNKPKAPTNVVLDAFGLTTFFGSVVGGDRLPSSKPDPAMLHLVMKELRSRPAFLSMTATLMWPRQRRRVYQSHYLPGAIDKHLWLSWRLILTLIFSKIYRRLPHHFLRQ